VRRIAIMTLRGHSEVYPGIYEKVKIVAHKADICYMKDKKYADLFSITMYQDLDEYNQLMSIINENSIDYTFTEGREYTKKELSDAEYLDIGIVYPWEHDLNEAEDYGTKYSYENKCSTCGQGKTQISELIINTKKVKKLDMARINPEIIISDRLHELILRNNITGCELGAVRDYKGRDDEILYQLKCTNTLPSMDSQTKLEIKDSRFCFDCRRNGLFQESELIYKASDLASARDFNLSEEYIGLANYCMQRVIVSKKFFDLYMKSKLRGINRIEPIKILE
jgi:hypothetical protein